MHRISNSEIVEGIEGERRSRKFTKGMEKKYSEKKERRKLKYLNKLPKLAVLFFIVETIIRLIVDPYQYSTLLSWALNSLLLALGLIAIQFTVFYFIPHHNKSLLIFSKFAILLVLLSLNFPANNLILLIYLMCRNMILIGFLDNLVSRENSERDYCLICGYMLLFARLIYSGKLTCIGEVSTGEIISLLMVMIALECTFRYFLHKLTISQRKRFFYQARLAKMEKEWGESLEGSMDGIVIVSMGMEVLQHNVELLNMMQIFVPEQRRDLAKSDLINRMKELLIWVSDEQEPGHSLHREIMNFIYLHLQHHVPETPYPPRNFHCKLQHQGFLKYEIKVRLIKYNAQQSVIVVFKDIRKLKDLEIANAAARQKSLLIATASHEFRTPINGMLVMLQILDHHVTTEGKSFLQVAESSSGLLLSLLNDVLDFAQMESGKLRINFTQFDVRTIIKETCKLVEFQPKQRGVDITYDLHPNIPREICSDENRIRQILLNLLGNAIKFTYRGYIRVRGEMVLRADVDAEKAKYGKMNQFLVVEVEDTGLGIKEEDLKHLFTLFGKGKATRSVNTQGIGLGLTISKSFVELLGGEMSVSSTEGKGTTFTFTVQVRHRKQTTREMFLLKSSVKTRQLTMEGMSEGSLHKVLNKSNSKSQSWVRKPISSYTMDIKTLAYRNMIQDCTRLGGRCSCSKVLIVDDSAFNLYALESLLHLQGIHCQKAENGEIAIKRALEAYKCPFCRGYSLIFMDCNMPVIDGFEASSTLIDLIKQDKLRKFPIIALTAYADDKHLEKIFQTGMDDYLPKPIATDQLKRFLEKYRISSETPTKTMSTSR